MKSILFTSALALFGTAILTQTDLPTPVKNHVKTLKETQYFTAKFSVRKVSGGLENETLAYMKGGKFKIETPSQLAVSDGKMVWILNKHANTYSDVWAWAAFFNEDALKGTKEYEAKGTRTVKSVAMTEYAGKTEKGVAFSLYIDPKTGIARGYSSGDLLVLATDIVAGKGDADTKEFTFTPPAGAKKEEPKPEAEAVSYSAVEPILKNSCLGCHNSGNAKAGLAVDSYEGVMKKVTAGDAAASALYRSISGARPRMPKGGAPLSQKDQDTIAAWINSGAKK
jgi:outer membrane lipoprotein-sorting protein